MCNQGSMGSSGRQFLLYIGPWPSAHWLARSPSFPWLVFGQIFPKVFFYFQVMGSCLWWAPSFVGIFCRNPILSVSPGWSWQSCWSFVFCHLSFGYKSPRLPQMHSQNERCGETCRNWLWTSLGRAGSGSTSICCKIIFAFHQAKTI